MAENLLDDDRFRDALGAYEGILAGRSGQTDQGAAHREVVAIVEGIFPGFREALEAYVDEQENTVKRIKDGDMIRKDGGRPEWYSGAKTRIGEWPAYRRRLEQGGLPTDAVESIHRSTDRILRQCANPRAVGDRRKGLVIGYVQSGKTANFTGLIAKAVDEGYRIIIVLAGMYTNLRVQTQLRLQKDLGIDIVEEHSGLAWQRFTSRNADMGKDSSPGVLSSTSNVALMVVKKHEMRLANVTKFLKSIPEATLNRRPVMIIDDESDQATPNTLGAKDLVSTINKRIRALWAAVPTGTYVAYTATPFANVFIDPSDDGDLYPEDFVSVLPKPDSYMGSELFFDVDQTVDSGEDEVIHQLAHEVPEHEAQIFTPRPKKIDEFSPEMTPTLAAAIRWFILATAIRELRTSKSRDSSMLVHTSQLVRVHQQTKEVISGFISDVALDIDDQEAEFRSVYEAEKDRAVALRGSEEMPGWATLWPAAKKVLEGVVVKIDNGASDDRLVYDPDTTQTVIAVGGGTLSRGLTLEGLVVSYFLRSSNTYDTLLQMGRWFGFRPGYADLVRVWMGPGLLDEYAHLATVEKQLRDEVAEMEKEGRTPREFAIKVKSHPGRLEITSKGKMEAARLARAGLGGTRRQTIYLDKSAAGRERALEASSGLVRRAIEIGRPVLARGAHSARRSSTQMYQGLKNTDLLAFLEQYWVSPTDRWLQPEGMASWLRRHGADAEWNLVLVSGSSKSDHEYAPGVTVQASRRAPLKSKNWSASTLGVALPDDAEIVNIRALMAGDDYTLDLRILADNGELDEEDLKILDGVDKRKVSAVKAARSLIRPDQGAILLYAVDGQSEPAKDSQTRTSMDADGTIIGLGVVFPHAEDEDPEEYWSVELEEQDAEAEAAVARDEEGDYVRNEES
ncbi:Z1 domain-containing protein [Brachybacterium sp. EE-P12]|uniref:Z1 domain-containing protein n=1 Tax=Brachybacterium sp. EE-P12 TaxID=2306299 RepID=UPI0013DDE775|nr:Z1 domain-containing protein [Brachybacterium sp. EE-P12]